MIFNFFTFYKNYFMKNHVFQKVAKLINFCKIFMKFNQNWSIFVKISCFFHFFCLFFNFLSFLFFLFFLPYHRNCSMGAAHYIWTHSNHHDTHNPRWFAACTLRKEKKSEKKTKKVKKTWNFNKNQAIFIKFHTTFTKFN